MTRRTWFVGLLVVSRAALADDTHYQDFVIGGRAAALGGAFAAISDDPSGLYYNPAGLTDVKRLSLSVSTSLYGIESGDVSPGDGQNKLADASNLSFADVNIIAGEVGGVKTFNLHPQRGADFALGFAVEVPSYRNLQVSRVEHDPVLGTSEYRRRMQDRTLWVGAGGAVRADHAWSFGLSTFYLLRTYEESEESAESWQARVGGEAFAEEKFRVSLLSGSALAILGVKWKGPLWSFGLALGSPTLDLHGSGEASYLGNFGDPDAATEGRPVTVHQQYPAPGKGAEAEVESQSKLGGFARFGMAYVVPRTSTWSLDVTAHLPTSYSLVKSSDPVFQEVLDRFPRMSTPVRRKAVINVNTGYEYLFNSEFSLAAGFFTDFSSVPEDDKARPQVSLAGGTLAVGYFGDHSLTRLGLSFSTSFFGVDSVRDLTRVRNVSDLVSIDVSQSFLYIFLASTFRY